MITEEPIKCPFCGNKTVLATVITTLSFKSEHTLNTTGVDMNEDSVGEMFGEPNGTTMSYSSFRCTSCDKKWTYSKCKPVKDENGILSFESLNNKKT